MDQSKIGTFIAALRGEHGLTQKELAQMLHISDKTVSKWETGRGLPDVSLMPPLCDVLGISINELLSAERLDETRYRAKAEENMVTLLRRRSMGKKLLRIVCSMLLFAASFAVIVLTAGKILPVESMPVAVFCNCLLLVANLAAWTIYGVLRKWGGVYVVLTALLDMAFIGVTLWLLGILTVVFSVR